MATTIETPEADQSCAYCGCAIFDHDPICVRELTDDCGNPTYYCNHGCLAAHIDEGGLATGSTCRWEP